MRDEFRADPETGDLICNTCRPQFRFKWAQMKPEEGKQRQFNKGNLKTHIKANNIHTDLVEAAGSRAKGGLFNHFKRVSKAEQQQQQQGRRRR